jgi:uncharacterized protein involved in outer membrane biogenesis
MNQDAIPVSPPKAGAPRRWLRILLGCMAVLAVLLTGIGVAASVWLPEFARERAQVMLSETLGRKVSIGMIDIAPLALELRVRDISMDQPGQSSPALRIAELRASLGAASLLEGAPVIKELVITSPQIWLGRDSSGRLSIADVLAHLSAAPPSAGPPPRFAVRNIRLDDGAITFDDQTAGQLHRITALALRIPLVSMLPADAATPIEADVRALVAEARLQMRARTLLADAAASTSVDIDLQGFDLKSIAAYARQVPGLAITDGLLDAQLKAQARGSIEGELRITNLGARMLMSEGGWKAEVDGLQLIMTDIAVPLSAPGTEGRVGQLRLALAESSGVITLRDTGLPDVAALKLSGLKASIDTLRFADDQPLSLAVESQVNGSRGKIVANGTASGWTDPRKRMLDLSVNARGIDIVALQGLMAEHLPAAVLTRGSAGFVGQVRMDGPSARIAGNARLDDINLLSRQDATEIGRWKSLRLDGLAVQTSPLDIRLPSVVIDGLFGRLTLQADGRLNIVAATTSSAAPPAASPAAPVTPKASASPPAAAPVASSSLPLTIGTVRVNDANVVFTDQKTRPNFRMALTGLSGSIGPLRPGTPGPIELRGTIDRSAPVQIQGRFDPLGPQFSADLSLMAKGIDMPALSPYTVRHLAYPIEKGKLSLDLRYRIDNGQIHAENRIFLDQLTFGERIESPDALSIPLMLAVALLKNRRGEIDIQLPISGSLNDPQFSIGSIVFKALVNLLVKAVTAPFALIASLFGNSADLSQITFAPGSAAMDADAAKAMGAIAKAMLDRPGIRLEVNGFADRATDADALRRQALNRQIRAEKLAAMATRGQAQGTLRDVDILPEEYPVLLAQIYRKAYPAAAAPSKQTAPTPPVADMEAALLAAIPAGDAELTALADQRSRAARDWLAQQGIETARIFLLGSDVESGTPRRAAFSMR